MNSERKDIAKLTQQASTNCTLDAEGHCITCSDEALKVYVLSVDSTAGLALVVLST